MNEVELWFETEFSRLGFSLSPIVYDPVTFTPRRYVIYKFRNGELVNTGIMVTPELVQDLHDYHNVDAEQEYMELVRQEIYRFLDTFEDTTSRDFSPRKKIYKFNFI